MAALLPGPVFGLAALDASTGDLRATEVPAPADAGLPSALAQELLRLEPRELLCPGAARAGAARRRSRACSRTRPGRWSRRPASSRRTRRPSRTAWSPARPAPPREPPPGCWRSWPSHQPFALAQISRLRSYRLSDSMLLDAATRAHLELFRNGEDGSRRAHPDRADRPHRHAARRAPARELARLSAARPRGDRGAAAGGRLAGRPRPAARPPARGAAPRARSRAGAREAGATLRDAARSRLAARIAGGAAGGVRRARERRGRGARGGRRRAAGPAARARGAAGAGADAARGAGRRSARARARLARRARDRLPARGLPRRARRPARSRAQGARVDRGSRGAGARAHRHRLAQDPLPSGARLRHRDLEAAAAPGARPTTSASRRSRAPSASRPPSCATSSRT